MISVKSNDERLKKKKKKNWPYRSKKAAGLQFIYTLSNVSLLSKLLTFQL